MARERILYLVRHGQYTRVPEVRGGVLTPLGRAQARQTGKRLAELPITAVHCSDLSRAVETAEIIAAGLGHARVTRLPMLRECLPTALPGMTVPLLARRRAKQSIEAIAARFFCPSARVRHELLVCHGNLIRALVCRALGARLTTWRRMDVHHGGITSLVVRSNGAIRIASFNDTGHLRGRLLTMV